MTPPDKIRVLIVDDVPETRENIRKLLQFESDLEVVGAARTGREAIRFSQEMDPHVVLMDINMPDMDGITATEQIRQKMPQIQVVILTVQGDPNYMRRALKVGARDFLTKPPMADELTAAIRRAGSVAREERAKNAGQEENLSLLRQELELSIADVASRLTSYKESPITGSLIDEIELLIAGFAHDVRSPINIILSILSTIPTVNSKEKEFVSVVARRCLYCKWVADNFLGITMSEKKTLKDLQLIDNVKENVSLIEDRISKKIEIKINIPIDLYAYTDANLFNFVFINIIVNALESIRENGTIQILAQKNDDKVLITIEDDGIAIPEKLSANLFKFGFTTKNNHAGIGLYVSRRLLRQQGGDLLYVRLGQNKVFGILLPPLKKIERNTNQALIMQLQSQLSTIKNELKQAKDVKLTDGERELVQKEYKRLATTFSHNLSHELYVIESTVNNMVHRCRKDSKMRASLLKIIKNCDYCRLLTNNILEIGEETTPNFTNVSLIAIIQDVLSLVDRKMPADLYQITWNIDPTVEYIEADDIQMKQVFMNLIRNALDAMPHGGSLGIEIGQKNLEAIIEISDTGIGISPENMPHLFQLGFTTKLKGYGIGLYSIKNIVAKHGGKINVSSKVGRGTSFIIHLPIRHKRRR
jgi:signal transduction histidine kinase